VLLALLFVSTVAPGDATRAQDAACTQLLMKATGKVREGARQRDAEV
jgi:hypothetical protein